MVNGNNCVKLDSRKCKIGKEGRKGVSFENLQKEIAGKSSRIMKWEVRQGQKSAEDCTQIWGLPSLHQPFLICLTIPLSLEALVKPSFFLTFFSLQLLWLFSLDNILLQFLKLTVLLARPKHTNKQETVGKGLLQVSVPCKCRLNGMSLMLLLCSCCSRAKSRSALCASLRMISVYIQLLQRLWLNVLPNYVCHSQSTGRSSSIFG